MVWFPSFLASRSSGHVSQMSSVSLSCQKISHLLAAMDEVVMLARKTEEWASNRKSDVHLELCS